MHVRVALDCCASILEVTAIPTTHLCSGVMQLGVYATGSAAKHESPGV